MKKTILIAALGIFCLGEVMGQEHLYSNVQIKDVMLNVESEWQASQIRAKVINIGDSAYRVELYDKPTLDQPTLYYDLSYESFDSKTFRYELRALNGTPIVNSGPGDYIRTTHSLKDMAQGTGGSIAINEYVLHEIVIYKLK